MPGTKQVLVDADALVGLINQNDALHSRCLQTAQFLTQNNFNAIVLTSTILEAATALSRGIKRPDLAKQLMSDYSQLESVPLPSEILSQLVYIYDSTVSTKNTPFDYFILAYAKLKQVGLVFSFDHFYKKHGLILAENLLKH